MPSHLTLQQCGQSAGALWLQELSCLPHNYVTAEYVDAMAAAVQEYGTADAVVLFVVQPGEKNSYDQQVCANMTPWCYFLEMK